jgi:hypothetical protein
VTFRRYPSRGKAEYSPGRVDARANEASAFLKTASHIRNVTSNGLRCQFNLKLQTAERLLEYETVRRANRSDDPIAISEDG